MSTKNLVRIVVVLGLLAWPTVELARLWSTNQQRDAALALEQSVSANLAKARVKNTQSQVAGTEVASPQ